MQTLYSETIGRQLKVSQQNQYVFRFARVSADHLGVRPALDPLGQLLKCHSLTICLQLQNMWTKLPSSLPLCLASAQPGKAGPEPGGHVRCVPDAVSGHPAKRLPRRGALEAATQIRGAPH